MCFSPERTTCHFSLLRILSKNGGVRQEALSGDFLGGAQSLGRDCREPQRAEAGGTSHSNTEGAWRALPGELPLHEPLHLLHFVDAALVASGTTVCQWGQFHLHSPPCPWLQRTQCTGNHSHPCRQSDSVSFCSNSFQGSAQGFPFRDWLLAGVGEPCE